jgi:arylsulfatase A-like enzyme
MRPLSFFAACCALACLTAACRAPEPPLAAANILLVVIDCLRADHVGAYGHTRPTTPVLDRLAAEGTIFRQAYAQAHWTRPSLPSLLTGLYPSEHGLLEVELNRQGRIIGPALAAEADTLAEQLTAAGYRTAFIGAQYQMAKAFQLDQGFSFFNNRAGRAPAISHAFGLWLDRHPGERFFVYLHYLDIHWPYCPPDVVRGRFDAGTSELSVCGGGRELRDAIRHGEIELSAADVERLAARYDESLLATDYQVGVALAHLERRGLLDDTLVVVTADHGEEFMEHGEIGHNDGLYDVLLHVPLIVRPPKSWPGEPRREVDAVHELRSVAPTLRQAAGASAGRGGPSLVPYLLGRDVEGVSGYAVAESSTLVSVRNARYRLVVDRRGGGARLYDRAAEPLEETDVGPSRPRELAELAAYLRTWSAGLAPLAPVPTEADEETLEGLKSLGYID